MKKWIIGILIAVLVIGGTAGGAYVYHVNKEKNRSVKVVSVMNISTQDWGSQLTANGTIQKSATQEVILTKEQRVKQVLVNTGDAVEIGTPLIQLDTTLLELDAKQSEIEMQKIDIDMKNQKKELEKLKKTKPYVPSYTTTADRTTTSRETNSSATSGTQSTSNTPSVTTVSPETPAPVEPTPTPPVETPAATEPTPAPPVETLAPTEPTPAPPVETPTATEPTPAPPVETPTATEPTPAPPVETPAPTEPTPAPPETPAPTPGTSNTINNVTQANSGDGSSENPYKFSCASDSYIASSLLLQLIAANQNAQFEFYNPDGTVNYIWELQGNTQGRAVAREDVDNQAVAAEDAPITDANGESYVQVGSQITRLYPAANFNLKASSSGTSSSASASSEETSSEENYYTRDELDRMIQEKQEKIRDLELSRREQELAYKVAQKKLQDSVIQSTVKGTVGDIGDAQNVLNDGKPFMIVNSGESGLYMTGTISEMMLDQIHVGDVLNGQTWGAAGAVNCEATVTEISKYPTANANNFGGNPNASYYPFTAYIQNTEGLEEGMWIDINIGIAGDQNALFIERLYVRDENDSSYVYAVNQETGLLEKRTVKTGKIIQESYIEIKEGLTLEDYVAVPYGKDAKEGIKASMSGLENIGGENNSEDMSEDEIEGGETGGSMDDTDMNMDITGQSGMGEENVEAESSEDSAQTSQETVLNTEDMTN